MTGRMKRFAATCLGLGLALMLQPAVAETVLRVKLDGELKEIDPIWTSNYTVRDHAYMVYDTLFAMDDKYNVQPQMVDRHAVSEDGKTYTLTLRDGLKWHDGTPVTARDCIASLKRWGKRDGLGQQMMARLERFEQVDDKTFRIVMKENWSLVLPALGKISSTVPFMMPERLANTDAFDQVKEPIGSGPFKMKIDEWVPGSKIVYVKNQDYVPRQEPPSNAAGGKVAKVDRIEWLVMPDPVTAVNALANGEIDYLATVPPDLTGLVARNKNVKLQVVNLLGKQVQVVPNHLNPPFDNVKVRQALQLALKQEDYMQAMFGKQTEFYQVCAAVFFCGTKFATDVGSERVLKQDFAAAKALLKEAGYDGTPIVLLHATDLPEQNLWGQVGAESLRKAGFVVNDVTSDWATVASRRASKKPIAEGGWHLFHTGWAGPDMLDPAVNVLVSGGCVEKAWFGWPCDAELERLRAAFASTSDPAEQKKIADLVQARAHEIVTFVPMGQFRQLTGYRANISGVLTAPVPFMWNIAKN